MKQAEIFLLVTLVCYQLYLFFSKNRPAIKQLSEVYPDSRDLELIEDEGHEVINPGVNASIEFQKIIHSTNGYLRNNKGAAADLSLLKDISESSVESMDERVQAQVVSPLYIGLLGTFIGAIIGIASILPSDQTLDKKLVGSYYAVLRTTSGLSQLGLGLNTSGEEFERFVNGNEINERKLFTVLGSNKYFSVNNPSAAAFHTKLYSGSESISSEEIGRFLFGVMIAMVGSLTGLGLTVLGNNLLKDARVARNERKKDYYNFLRIELLPVLNTDMQKGMGDLKAVLDAFNQGFFGKIETQLFAKLNQILPLMSKMGDMIVSTGQNVAVQRDFLVKLEQVGITKLANNTIRIFDRIDASAQTFEKFMGYQTALNHTVQMGTDAAQEISQLLHLLPGVALAANELPVYLAKHDTTLNNVLLLLTEHQTTLKEVNDRMTRRLDSGIVKMEEQLDQSLVDLDAKSRKAHLEYEAWFKRLQEANVFQQIVTYLDPIKAIPAQQTRLNELVEKQSGLVAQALERMEQRLNADKAIQLRLEAQISQLSQALTGQLPQGPRRPITDPPRPPRNGNGEKKNYKSENGSTKQSGINPEAGSQDRQPVEGPSVYSPPKPSWWTKFKGIFKKRRTAATTDNTLGTNDNPSMEAPLTDPKTEASPDVIASTTPSLVATAEVVAGSGELLIASSLLSPATHPDERE